MCSGPDEISSNCLECHYGERLVSRNVPAGAARRRAMYRKLASRALAKRPGEHPNMRAIRVMLGRNDFVRERINSVDAVLAPTRVMARMLTQNGIRPELIRHSPYGLKLDSFAAVRQRRPPSSTVRFGYVGTLRQPKGVEILLEAFKRLPQSCDASLRIVGDMGDFPPYARSLYEDAREDRRINFTGIVPNERTAEQLAEIDVLVVPSTWYENSPTTILLAFAAGVPAIASDVPGVTEIVRRGDNALLFKMGDAGQLADCMRSVVDDAGLLSRLRANAEGLRTVEDSVDEALELYDVLRATPRANGTPARNGAGGERQRAAAPRRGTAPAATSGCGGRPDVRAKRRWSLTRPAGALRFAASASGCERGMARTRPARATGELGRPPFLITGRARSGTSWVMRILDAHPEILCGGEGRFYGARYRVGDSKVRSLHGALLASKPLRDWAESSGWTRGRDFRQEIGEMTAILADHVLARELARSGKRMVGDKTPLTTPTMLSEVAKLRPGTKVAHVIRDGRDVAVSSVHHLWNSDVRDGGSIGLAPSSPTQTGIPRRPRGIPGERPEHVRGRVARRHRPRVGAAGAGGNARWPPGARFRLPRVCATSGCSRTARRRSRASLSSSAPTAGRGPRASAWSGPASSDPQAAARRARRTLPRPCGSGKPATGGGCSPARTGASSRRPPGTSSSNSDTSEKETGRDEDRRSITGERGTGPWPQSVSRSCWRSVSGRREPRGAGRTSRRPRRSSPGPAGECPLAEGGEIETRAFEAWLYGPEHAAEHAAALRSELKSGPATSRTEQSAGSPFVEKRSAAGLPGSPSEVGDGRRRLSISPPLPSTPPCSRRGRC